MRKSLLSVAVGACLSGVAFASVAAATPADEAHWEVVPDQTLRDLRGGVDLGQSGLVANFAINRVVTVDGQVVASMQIVISNLGELGSGVLPTVSVTGVTAEIVQILNAAGLSVSAAATPATTAAAPTAVATTAAATTAVATTAAATTAVATTAAATTSAAPTAVATTAVATTAAATTAAATPAAATPAAATTAAATTSAATTSPVIVVSDLPNATAITTAVQNEVNNAKIQVQTSIQATLNSLSALSAISLANSIRSQVNASLQ